MAKHPDQFYYDKEAQLSIRAKFALLEMRVKHEVTFPWVPGLACFEDPDIRDEIDIKLGTGSFDGSHD